MRLSKNFKTLFRIVNAQNINFHVCCVSVIMETEDEESAKNEALIAKSDEIDALPPELRYNNFDLSCTIISILTYIFDLVRTFLYNFTIRNLG